MSTLSVLYSGSEEQIIKYQDYHLIKFSKTFGEFFTETCTFHQRWLICLTYNDFHWWRLLAFNEDGFNACIMHRYMGWMLNVLAIQIYCNFITHLSIPVIKVSSVSIKLAERYHFVCQPSFRQTGHFISSEFRRSWNSSNCESERMDLMFQCNIFKRFSANLCMEPSYGKL